MTRAGCGALTAFVASRTRHISASPFACSPFGHSTRCVWSSDKQEHAKHDRHDRQDRHDRHDRHARRRRPSAGGLAGNILFSPDISKLHLIFEDDAVISYRAHYDPLDAITLPAPRNSKCLRRPVASSSTLIASIHAVSRRGRGNDPSASGTFKSWILSLDVYRDSYLAAYCTADQFNTRRTEFQHRAAGADRLHDAFSSGACFAHDAAMCHSKPALARLVVPASKASAS
ncbi:RNA binding protein [Marssonina coronariae]|uniref:RNA binding protein n=1 Tax=Diplocarpon coronariae TaxID=2795749 RepID=A0A218YT78_9HELO|nr:RNA binding protein [Marssonina coronariae]